MRPSTRYPVTLTIPNKEIPTAIAAAAPELIPSRPGSASGLRVRDCMIVPAVPSASPTTTAFSARGIRD